MQRLVLAALFVAALTGPPALAHQFEITDVEIELDAQGGYRVDILVDIDALALGVSPATDSNQVAARLQAMSEQEFTRATERARSTLARRLRVRFDDIAAQPEILFRGSDDPEFAEIPTVLGIVARLQGRVPDSAGELTFFASRAFGVVHAEIREQATGTVVRHVLAPGEPTPVFVLGAPSPPPDGLSFVRFVMLGFEHILPWGLDHILFVLGLFLLSTRAHVLVWQITAFTVAHSLTLALALYGVVELPSRPVETLIALSIAYVGIENMATSELKPWRPVLVFAFGLLHGLGFAGALREIELPREQFLAALVGFNVGVELGQLAVIGLALICVGWFRDRQWYRARIVVPLSAVIALAGVYWAIQRAFL